MALGQPGRTLDEAMEMKVYHDTPIYGRNSSQIFFSLTKEIGGVSDLNIYGNIVKTFSTDKFSMRIDVSDLPIGVYQLIVNFGKHKLTKPFTILRVSISYYQTDNGKANRR